MIWLITLGLSRHHGSELLVGWQWYQRLKSRAEVTVVTHSVFDSGEYLRPEDRVDIRFVDTNVVDPDDLNRRHVLHSYRFWAAARRMLAREAQAGDKVVIVSPAALWFFPVTAGLPMHRAGVFYGPIGVTTLSGGALPGLSAVARNCAFHVLMLAWWVLSPLMPKNVSLRFPQRVFMSRLKNVYDISDAVPEVELPDEGPKHEGAANTSAPILVLYDQRVQKNFKASFHFALRIAREDLRRLVVLGAPPEVRDYLSHEALLAGAHLEFRDRLARSVFVDWLRSNRPSVVALSLSEGVPSTLIEALGVGCDAFVLEAGGVTWLIRFASKSRQIHDPCGRIFHIEWNVDSHAGYSRCVREEFRRLVDKVVANKQSDLR